MFSLKAGDRAKSMIVEIERKGTNRGQKTMNSLKDSTTLWCRSGLGCRCSRRKAPHMEIFWAGLP